MKRLISKVIVMIPLTLVVLATLSVPTFAQSREKPAPSQYSTVPPAGHEAFFEDLGELMNKYPESAKRFGIWDRQVVPKKLSDEQKRIIRSRGCPEGQGCGFYCWTSPVNFECCECNIRPKSLP